MANPAKRKPPVKGLTKTTRKLKGLAGRMGGNLKDTNTYSSSDEDSEGFGDNDDDEEETGEETMRAMN